jgi:hypothetical protein
MVNLEAQNGGVLDHLVVNESDLVTMERRSLSEQHATAIIKFFHVANPRHTEMDNHVNGTQTRK